MKLCRTVGHDDAVPDREPLSQFQQLSGPGVDKWALAGNKHLLAHLVRGVGNHQVFTAEQTQNLVKSKNGWVSDMRDLDTGEGVPVDVQKSLWREYIEGIAAAI